MKEKAWQSGLVLLDETPEWNFEDWPPLAGGWRCYHASVVLDHPDNKTEQTVVVLGGYRTGYGEVNSILVLNLADPDKQWRGATNEQESSRTCRCFVQWRRLRDGRSQYSNFGLYRTH